MFFFFFGKETNNGYVTLQLVFENIVLFVQNRPKRIQTTTQLQCLYLYCQCFRMFQISHSKLGDECEQSFFRIQSKILFPMLYKIVALKSLNPFQPNNLKPFLIPFPIFFLILVDLKLNFQKFQNFLKNIFPLFGKKFKIARFGQFQPFLFEIDHFVEKNVLTWT